MTAWVLAGVALAGQISAEGVHARIAEQRGRAVVVSFWATWCEPCRREFPALAALVRERPELALIAVSIDDDADRPAVEGFVREMAPPFPVYIKAPGPDQAFIDAVDPKWSGVVPMTLVFDAQGRRSALITGEHGRAEIERALAALAQAGNKAKAP
jgi:thiol-disulfide isomerase/thioredoxin